MNVDHEDLARVLEHALVALDDREDSLYGHRAESVWGEDLKEARDEFAKDKAAYRRLAGYSPDAD